MSGQNVTVDDADPSITYVGPNWKTQTCDQTCSAKPPNLSQVNDGTWHDGRLLSPPDPNQPMEVHFSFTGTAIYVFGITVNSTSPLPAVKNQDLVFTLDGQNTRNFTFTPNGPDYNYNVNFFSQTGLNAGMHTLNMAIQNNSFVLFDYFIYTAINPSSTSSSTSSGVTSAASSSGTNNSNLASATPSPSPSPSTTSSGASPGTIVGAVVGSIGGITIIAFIIFLIRYYRQDKPPPPPASTTQASSNSGRRSRRRSPAGRFAVEPFIIPPQPPPPPPNSNSTGPNPATSHSTIPVPSSSVDPPTTSSGSAARSAGRGSSRDHNPELAPGIRAEHWQPPSPTSRQGRKGRSKKKRVSPLQVTNNDPPPY